MAERPRSLVSIMLVEDIAEWQAVFKALIATSLDLTLVSIVDNYDDALSDYDRLKPEIILLDWQIRGDKDGLEVGHALMARGVPSERLVVVSGSPPSAIPAHPFLSVPKSRLADELVSLILSVTKD